MFGVPDDVRVSANILEQHHLRKRKGCVHMPVLGCAQKGQARLSFECFNVYRRHPQDIPEQV